MPKEIKAKIYGPTDDPCIITGSTECVAEVQIGRYTYPLYIGSSPLWDKISGEVKDDKTAEHKDRGSDSGNINKEIVGNGKVESDTSRKNRRPMEVRTNTS